jgi:hypothetical protein
MARLTETEARKLADAYGICLTCDYHTLSNAAVGDIARAANLCRYREPRNANGSRTRYFHAYLVRAARLTGRL